MFLKELLNHNRIMFAGLILFILAFIFINLKWGAVVTPVYTPGMFSGKMFRSDSFITYRIFKGRYEINLSAMHFTQKDVIVVSLNRYRQHQQVNRAVKDILRKIPGFSSVVNELWFNKITNDEFLRWLKKKLPGNNLLPSELTVYEQRYTWDGKISESEPLLKLF